MNNIKIKLLSDVDIAIKYFIDNELNAPHINSVIFLYCLKNYDIITNLMQICVKTNSTQDQVKYCFEFWEARGLCEIEFDGENNVHNIKLFANKDILVKKEEIVKNETIAQVANVHEKSNYKPEEIKYFLNNNEEIKKMFYECQRVLCKNLTHNEMNSLLDYHERLNLPCDVIVGMVNYCVMNDKRDFRYINKVVLGMSDQGINTVQKLNDHTNKNKDVYKQILEAIGATNTMVSPAQSKLIDKWLVEFGFTSDIVLEACDKACLNASKPTLRYVDGILENWKKENIKTLQDVIDYETRYMNNKQGKASKNSNGKLDFSGVKTKQSNFNNFDGHKRDLDDIAKKLNALR